MGTFKASDGKEFSDRHAWRLYEFELSYTFKNIVNPSPVSVPTPSSPMPASPHTKGVGSTDGQPFDIADCKNATLLVLDNTDQVQIDNVEGSRIFVAASSESIFVRDCTNCVFTIACKQLRTRDCKNCTFYLYSKTEPIIETSTGMSFAPFNGAFKGHREAMLRANLIPEHNLWFAVYDFNDEGRTGKNWRLVEDKAEWEPTWCPLGEFENCCPLIAKGSIALPSQSGDGMGGGVTLPVGGGGGSSGIEGMMSFGFETSLHDAAAATGDAYVAQETAGAAQANGGVPKPPKKKSGIGWNPGAFSEHAAALPAAGEGKKKSGVGWNPDAASSAAASPVPVPATVAGPAPSGEEGSFATFLIQPADVREQLIEAMSVEDLKAVLRDAAGMYDGGTLGMEKKKVEGGVPKKKTGVGWNPGAFA